MNKFQIEKTLNRLKKTLEKKQSEIFRLKEIIDDLPASIYWKNKKGAYLGFNKAGAESARSFNLPYLEKDIIGKTDHDIFPKEMADVFRNNDVEVMQKNQTVVREEATITPSGEKAIQLSTKKPLYDEKGKIVGVVGSTVDITHLKKIESDLNDAKERAEIANKAKTEFLENMRHDIRTPLTGIVGFAGLIKEEATDKKIRQYADNLVASSNALLDFMNSILEAIRMDSSKDFIIKNKFDMKKLLQSVIDINKAKAEEKNLKLKLIYDKNIPDYLMGDARKINRVIHEFVTNALNFTHKGHIKVSVKLENKNSKLDHKEVILNFSVEDTGIGIPVDKTNEIFMQFNRLHPAYDGVYKGLGLGLTSVKEFVDAMEGELYVKSQTGKGTVFTCLLPFKKPLLNNDFGASEIKDIEPLNQAKKTLSQKNYLTEIHLTESEAKSHVLLVEDSEIAILFTKTMLESLNCIVDVAEDGKNALAKAKIKKYDFVFMDVGLPDMDGCRVTQRIRKFEALLDRHTPIVALTAHVEKENKEKCIKFGMDAVISKPLLKETAIDILNAFIPKRAVLKNREKRNIINGKTTDLQLTEISGEIIDVSAKLYQGDVNFLKELVKTFVDSFSKEIETLKKFYKNNDWKKIQDLAHKMNGGAAYCGTPRLKIACANLQHCINSGQKELRESLYQQVFKEIEAVKDAYQNM